jgi:photosystem II stability/assembly factor-like uncharacterized protein
MSHLAKIWLCLICLLLAAVNAQIDGWQVQDSGTDRNLLDVFFVNADTGWAVGKNVILNTTDGGENWTIQDSSSYEFFAVSFTDASHGWVVGYKETGYPGIIYHTSNGGQHWFLKDSCSYELGDIFFVDADTGYVVGGARSHATILKTTNGGSTWDMNYSAYGEWLYTTYFATPKDGWAAGGEGYVMKTEDGGKNWQYQYLDIGYANLLSIHFSDPDTGWVVGGSDNIFKSTDGGDSWQIQEIQNNFDYHCCYFTNSQTGWLAVRDLDASLEKILYTTDGGDSWHVQDSLADVGLFAIFFVDDNTGWIVGWPGKILKTTTGGITSIHDRKVTSDKVPDKFVLYQNRPNPFNPSTVISWRVGATLMSPVQVELTIYNMLGQKVSMLVSEKQEAGLHAVEWDASGMASGVYYYRLQAEGFVQTRKLVLLK